MRLRFAILAESAEVTDSGRVSMLGGDIEALFASEFPFTQDKLSLICKLYASPSEIGKPHHLRIHLDAPDGGVIWEIAHVNLPVDKNSIAAQDESEIGVIGDLGPIAFPAPGTYLMRFNVGEEEVGILRLYVVKAEDGHLVEGDAQ